MIRTSNAYVFRDPQAPPGWLPNFKSEKSGRNTGIKNFKHWRQVVDPDGSLERALLQLGASIKEDCSTTEAAGHSPPPDQAFRPLDGRQGNGGSKRD